MKNYLNKGNEMNSGKMEMDGCTWGKSRKLNLASSQPRQQGEIMKVSVSMVALLNASLALLRSRGCFSMFVLTMSVLLAPPTAQAQPPRQKPPELTLNQVIEFCEPQVKAYDEGLLTWFAEQAAWSREKAASGRSWNPSDDLEQAKKDDERAADLRTRGYQSEHSGARPSTLEWLNKETSAKDVRELILSWQDTLKRIGGPQAHPAGAGFQAPPMLCMLELRLAQIQGKALGGATVKQSGNKPTGNLSPATSPTTMGATGGGHLSSQQVTSCSEEIKNKQIESQSWGGNVDDVAARLGQFQKGLFEGRCAGHPEAQAYIAGANKMLGYGGNATGSGGNSGGNQANVEIQGSPQCAKYYIVSETPETRTSDKMFSFGIQNICNFPVYIHWNGYFNDVETQSIDYSHQLKKGTNSRLVFGPGGKIEAIPFNIANKRRFHVKIHSVCPTEEEATRLTGKRIDRVALDARGMCIAQILDTRGVRSSQ